MRGNAWQVTAIIAIILVVVLMVPLVIMGRDHQNKTEGARQAQQAERAAAQKAATLEGENRALKALIGVPEATALDELRKEHARIMEKALPGENDSTRTYHDAFTALLDDLEKVKIAHGTMGNQHAQRQSDLINEKNRFDSAVTRITQEKDNVESERRT